MNGVAMGAMGCAMFTVRKQLETEDKIPAFYKRYVDDTLSVMPDVETASEFLTTVNNSHPFIDFTMELEENGQTSLSGNGDNQESIPTRYNGVPKANGHWTIAILPQPRGREK